VCDKYTKLYDDEGQLIHDCSLIRLVMHTSAIDIV